MDRTLTISEETYSWLQSEVEKRRLKSIEELLEVWKAEDPERIRRGEVVARIEALSERLDAKYGLQADSVDLIREDRDR